MFSSAHNLCTVLMKLTLVARKAIEAYLIISALTKFVAMKGTATLGLRSSSLGKLCSIMGS
jgi:hypothetical protein